MCLTKKEQMKENAKCRLKMNTTNNVNGENRRTKGGLKKKHLVVKKIPEEETGGKTGLYIIRRPRKNSLRGNNTADS